MIDNQKTEEGAKLAQETIAKTEKIMPLYRATEKTRRAEMRKTIDLCEASKKTVGDFCEVYGSEEEKFVVFNEPIEVSQKGEGETAEYEVSLIFATEQGFKQMAYPQKVAAKDLVWKKNGLRQMPKDMLKKASEAKSVPKYRAHPSGYEEILAGGGYALRLADVGDESLVDKAIKTSIAEFQEGPKQVIAKNQRTIGIATKAQSVLTGARAGK